LVAAINTGNNLLYLVLACQCGALVLSNALAEWNLRGLTVTRRLPSEPFAGDPAAGALVVTNRRRRGSAFALRVEEVGPTGAAGRAALVAAGGDLEVPVRWTFPERGETRLQGLRVRSSYPFGLVERTREVDAPARLLVFPNPTPGPPAAPARGAGEGRADPRFRGREGYFRGLREYGPGDALRDIHWPTTARVGTTVVVERSAGASDEVVVRVDDARGQAWEDSLSLAAGQLLQHFATSPGAKPSASPATACPWSRGKGRSGAATSSPGWRRRGGGNGPVPPGLRHSRESRAPPPR
jgi:uncharacterized protein (DUF58 family)